MKKYLMTGVAALAFAATFTSCSKTDLYDENKVNEQKEATVKESYATAFEQAFGKPAKGHHWGFGSTTRAAGTRQIDDNGNIWYQYWERPYNVNLSDAEINELKALLTREPETYNTEIFPYENYYMEQIYTGESEDYAYDDFGDRTDTKVKGSAQMNHLQARNGNTYEHSDNFNRGGNNDVKTDQETKEKYYGITLLKGMSLDGITATNQFGYDESWGTENGKFYNNYLIVQYKGEWYVGFDFEAHKSATSQNHGEARQVNRDWAFTDWIVRVSPAYHKSKENGRVFCEDLGTIGDFDFNDVVFDARIYADGNIDIQVLAAGGKLPISVAGTPIIIGQMTNTGVNAGGTQNIHIDPVNGKPKYATIKDIPIVVSGNNEATYALGAPEGEAPQKICVPIGTRWVDEYVNIKNAYPKFTDWVQDESVKFWEQPVAKYVDLILSNNN